MQIRCKAAIESVHQSINYANEPAGSGSATWATVWIYEFFYNLFENYANVVVVGFGNLGSSLDLRISFEKFQVNGDSIISTADFGWIWVDLVQVGTHYPVFMEEDPNIAHCQPVSKLNSTRRRSELKRKGQLEE